MMQFGEVTKLQSRWVEECQLYQQTVCSASNFWCNWAE